MAADRAAERIEWRRFKALLHKTHLPGLLDLSHFNCFSFLIRFRFNYDWRRILLLDQGNFFAINSFNQLKVECLKPLRSAHVHS